MHLGLLVNWVGSGSTSSYRFGSVFFIRSGRVPLLMRFGSAFLWVRVSCFFFFGSGRCFLSGRVGSFLVRAFDPSSCSPSYAPIRSAFLAPALIRLCISDPIRPLRSDSSSSIRSDPNSASVAFLFATFPKCWVPIRSDSLLSSTYPIRAPLSDPIRTLHCFLKLFQQVFTPFDDVFDHSNY